MFTVVQVSFDSVFIANLKLQIYLEYRIVHLIDDESSINVSENREQRTSFRFYRTHWSDYLSVPVSPLKELEMMAEGVGSLHISA